MSDASAIPDMARATLKEIRAAALLAQVATHTTSIDLGRLQEEIMIVTAVE